MLRVGETKTIALGEYTDIVVTEDWNPLDPEIIHKKYFALGVGLIYSAHMACPAEFEELVEFTAWRADSAAASAIARQHRHPRHRVVSWNPSEAHHEAQDQDRDRDDRSRWRCGGRHSWLRCR